MNRFEITYQLHVQEDDDLDDLILGISLEQSVELPSSLLKESWRRNIIGLETDRRQVSKQIWQVSLSYPIDNIGGELLQFLNILYGNISMRNGIKIVDVEWNSLTDLFSGPAFGVEALRRSWGIKERPLSCIPLKPMGTTTGELARACREFAEGGIDIIKDDHGLTNQRSAPFKDRVEACMEAIEQAYQKTGHKVRYFPNITSDPGSLMDRYQIAKDSGAGGVMVCPHLTGPASLNRLASQDNPVPVIAHPAFSGSLVTVRNQGFTPAFLYGQLWRALGADFSIYANAGGRFPFTEEQSLAIAGNCLSGDLPFKKTFPMPGGGLKRDTLPYWRSRYGTDTVFLIGGSLYQHPQGKRYAAEEIFKQLNSYN